MIKVWGWILLACLVHVAAWTAWLVLAAHHPVTEIPLVTEVRR